MLHASGLLFLFLRFVRWVVAAFGRSLGILCSCCARRIVRVLVIIIIKEFDILNRSPIIQCVPWSDFESEEQRNVIEPES